MRFYYSICFFFLDKDILGFFKKLFLLKNSEPED